MEGETLARLEKLLGRELKNAEKTRLQRIQDILKIGPNDALWSIIVALEYQRTHYEELPEKIREVSMEAITELTKVTKKSTIQPGSTREEKEPNLVKHLSIKTLIPICLPWGTSILCLLLLYGSLSMWAGFSIGYGQPLPPVLLLKMPVGLLIGILCMVGSIFAGILAAKTFSEGGGSWRKQAFIATGLLVPGVWSITVSIF